MATKSKRKKKTKANSNGGARDDRVMTELQRIHEGVQTLGTRVDAQGARIDTVTAEVRAQGTRLDALTAEVRANGTRLDALTAEVRTNGTEMRTTRDRLWPAVVDDRRRIDALELRVTTLEAGKH